MFSSVAFLSRDDIVLITARERNIGGRGSGFIYPHERRSE